MKISLTAFLYFFALLMLFASILGSLNAQTRDYRQTEQIIRQLIDRGGDTPSNSQEPSAPEEPEARAAEQPEKDSVLLKTGLGMYNGGSYEEAEKAFSRLTAEYPQSPYADAARIKLGKIYIRQGKYDKAAAELASVEEGSGEYPAALFDSGYCLSMQGKTDEAVSSYQTTAYSFPDHELADDALLQAGILLMHAGRGSEALSSFISLFSKYKNRETADDAVFYMGQVYERDSELRDIERAADIYKLFLKKASAGEKLFADSPLRKRTAGELERIERTYFKARQ